MTMHPRLYYSLSREISQEKKIVVVVYGLDHAAYISQSDSGFCVFPQYPLRKDQALRALN